MNRIVVSGDAAGESTKVEYKPETSTSTVSTEDQEKQYQIDMLTQLHTTNEADLNAKLSANIARFKKKPFLKYPTSAAVSKGRSRTSTTKGQPLIRERNIPTQSEVSGRDITRIHEGCLIFRPSMN